MKNVYAQFNERKKEQQVERRHRVSANLRGYLIQTEGPRKQNNQNRGGAYGWIYPDNDT